MWLKREIDPEPFDGEAIGETTPVEHPLPAPVVQPRELVLLGEAQRMIMEATSLDEIKDIRDKAEAARKYIESAQLGLLMQNRAAEVKLRAERRAGELLATLKLAGGDRRPESSGPTLEDLGISKHQSSRWQREAAVPDEVFERLAAKLEHDVMLRKRGLIDPEKEREAEIRTSNLEAHVKEFKTSR